MSPEQTLSDFARCVSNAIRARRKALGFTQEAFADHIRMHRAFYGSLERGEMNTQLRTLHRVCVGLGITLSQLFAAAEQAQALGNAQR
jgi:transcriptional regulator with XRE-family HTH domain